LQRLQDDPQDHERDRDPHDRVGELEAGRHARDTEHDGEARESIHACVVAVGDQRG
jgi:hypothetical protein